MQYKKYFRKFLFFSFFVIQSLYCMEELKDNKGKPFFDSIITQECEKYQNPFSSEIKEIISDYYFANPLRWQVGGSFEQGSNVNDIGLSQKNNTAIFALNSGHEYCYDLNDKTRGTSELRSWCSLISLHVYDTQNDTFVLFGTLQGHVSLHSTNSYEMVNIKHKECANAIALDVTHKRIVTGGDDYKACVWNCKDESKENAFLYNPTLALTLPHEGHVWKVVISKDGTQCATAALDGKARVFDVNNGRLLCLVEHDHKNVSFVHFCHEDKRIMSASDDGTVRITDIETNKEVTRLSLQGGIHTLCMNDDGTVLAVGSKKGEIRVWDVLNYTLLLNVDLPDSPVVNHVSLDASASLLAVGTQNKEEFIWNIPARKLVKEVCYTSPVSFSLLTKDSEKRITIVGNKTVLFSKQYNAFQYDLRKLMFFWLLVKRDRQTSAKEYIQDICKHLSLNYTLLRIRWSSLTNGEHNEIWRRCRRITMSRQCAREEATMKCAIKNATYQLLRKAIFEDIRTAL